MFYCEVHSVAYAKPSQFQGHWLYAHKDEPRPASESFFVEQVPEGTRIGAPPRRARSPSEPPAPPGTSTPGRASETTVTVPRQTPQASGFTFQDEEETHLDQLLDSIGVPQPKRQTIVKGWRNFPMLRQHPGNLDNHITAILGPSFRGSVQLVVHAMFPGAEPQDTPPQYMYGRPPYGRPSPTFWPPQSRWSNYSPPWEEASEGYYEPQYRQRMPAMPEDGADSPRVVELQKQVSGILEELKEERAERAQEKQEQSEKARDAVWQDQLRGVVGKVDSTFKEFGDMVKQLGDQIQQGHNTVETSRVEAMAAKIDQLNTTLTDQQKAQLIGKFEELQLKLTEMNERVNREPTGKTTEDLIASGLPLLAAKLDNLGSGVKEELQGIRLQAADGKLPNLNVPNAPATSRQEETTPLVETAQQIAGARALEDEILGLVASQSN